MDSQVTHGLEAFPALFTLMGPFLAVGLHVHVEVSLQVGSVVTQVTLVLLLLGHVGTFHVILELFVADKLFVAYLAGAW